MTEIPFAILPQYMWYNESIQVDKPLFLFLRKSSIKFCKFLVTMVPLKNGMSLTEITTYM